MSNLILINNYWFFSIPDYLKKFWILFVSPKFSKYHRIQFFTGNKVEHYWSIFTGPKDIWHQTHVIIKPLSNTNSLLIRSTLQQKLIRRFHCYNYCTLSREFWKYPLSSTQTLHNCSHLRMSVNTLKN